jgi:bacterioferritin (cytochrome b1)
MAELDKRKIHLLNRILEAELAGSYTHFSVLIFVHNRMPIVSWLPEQASESLTYAQQAGEMIPLLGEYQSLAISPWFDNHQTDIGAITRESLERHAERRCSERSGVPGFTMAAWIASHAPACTELTVGGDRGFESRPLQRCVWP